MSPTNNTNNEQVSDNNNYDKKAVFHVRFITEWTDDIPCVYITDECVFAGGANTTKPYDLEGLKWKLRALPLDMYSGYRIFLEAVTMEHWYDLDKSTWLKFCQLLKECVSAGASVLEIAEPHQLGDLKCAMVLKHLASPTLTTLLVTGRYVLDMPMAIRQIGYSFPNLEELQIKCQRPQTPHYMAKAIHRLLLQLHRLKVLVLKNVGAQQQQHQASTSSSSSINNNEWQPAFDFIRKNPNFHEVAFEDKDFEKQQSSSTTNGDDGSSLALLTQLQYGPRLNAAKQKHNLVGRDQISTIDFVEALISLRDRVDCLDYLLSTADPGLYARQAVTAVSSAGH